METSDKIKILIVDDSVLFRSEIQKALQGHPSLEVMGVASNGKLALERMILNPIDLVILDIEMPILDGIETLKEMKNKSIKTKAVMFSSQSTSGATRTLEAMNLGALDFVAKPLPDDSGLNPSEKIREALVPKILSLFGKETSTAHFSKKMVNSSTFLWERFTPDVLVIASSTGGPNALADYFSSMTDVLPFPILITQHMPPVFTTTFAQRLGEICGKVSREAVQGEVLKPNQIYMAPGNFHMSLGGTKLTPTINLDQKDQRNFVRPCADFLFESASAIFGSKTLGIVFTGMGRDGADGALAVKKAGGAVLIQDKESCVVFGMPGAVFDEGNFDYKGTPVDLANKTLLIAKKNRLNNVG